MRREFRERSQSHARRQTGRREETQRFLVVCEGEKTEPNYFRAFRVPGLDLRVEGAGDNTKNLVLIADRLRAGTEYDQVWCVFDRDSFPSEHFNAALQMATSRGIRIAYSNEAFEIWYLLHFDYLQSGVPRAEYVTRLSERLGVPYRKNSREIFDLLRRHQDTAIKNAKRLHGCYEPCCPERDNPSTTVHLLVEELMRFSR